MGSKSTEFFKVVPVTEALNLLFDHINPITQTETITTAKAAGRVLASAPTSPVNLPSFVRSTMDGFAVRAADTFGASQSLPSYLTLAVPVKMGGKTDAHVTGR